MGSSFEKWLHSVKEQMREHGMTSNEVWSAVEENEQWFREQYDQGAGTGITADEWFNLHHNVD